MKKYSGFTLIEMLIVMGIIIILMAAGVAGGRFAIQRANRIQKQNAVGNIEQALWGYYTDKRNFPTQKATKLLMETDGVGGGIKDYLDAGQWDGGSDADYTYLVSSDNQTFVVCATLGGNNDDQGYGIYCSGNGLQTPEFASYFFGGVTTLPSDNIFTEDNGSTRYHNIRTAPNNHRSAWKDQRWN